MNNNKYQVTGGNPLERYFVECVLANDRNDEYQLEARIRAFRDALATVPAAKSLIEARNYKGLLDHIKTLLEGIKDSTRFDNALSTFKMVEQKIVDHKRKEPMNRNSGTYMEWMHEDGRLNGLLQAALTEVKLCDRTKENQQKLGAIKVFYAFLDDLSAKMDEDIEVLKEEVGLSVLELRTQHAIETGQTHVGIPTRDSKGRKRVRMVPVEFFTNENFKVEELAPYFG